MEKHVAQCMRCLGRVNTCSLWPKRSEGFKAPTRDSTTTEDTTTSASPLMLLRPKTSHTIVLGLPKGFLHCRHCPPCPLLPKSPTMHNQSTSQWTGGVSLEPAKRARKDFGEGCTGGCGLNRSWCASTCILIQPLLLEYLMAPPNTISVPIFSLD